MSEERPPTGHYIVCGFGIIGYRIVELLHRLGEQVVVIAEDPREEWRGTALTAGIRVLDGDARDPKLQQRAGLGGAKALVASTDKDLVNIEIALDTKRIRPDLTVVVRLFDQSLARRLEESFDVRRAIGMATLAAPAFAAAAIGSDLVSNVTVGGEMFVVGERSESEASELRGLGAGAIARERGVAVLREPSRREARWTLVARRDDWNRMTGAAPKRAADRTRRTGWLDIWRDASPVVKGMLSGFLALIAISVVVFWLGMGLTPVDALYFVVTTVTTTGYGDITPRDQATWLKIYACLLMVLGSATVATFYSLITDFVITSRFRHLLGRRRVPEGGHVLVIGMGNVGYRVVQELAAAGVEVVALDRDSEAPYLAAVREQAAIVTGDARLPDVLAKARIQTARAVIAVSGDDAANLSIGLAARQLNPEVRTVVRLFDPDFARKVEASLSVSCAMGASRIAAPTFVAAALEEGVVRGFLLGDELVALIHGSAREEWVGLTPEELGKAGVVVLWRDPGGESSRPAAADAERIAEGERLLVARRRPLLREGLREMATMRMRV